jgi:hypothetical protein
MGIVAKIAGVAIKASSYIIANFASALGVGISEGVAAGIGSGIVAGLYGVGAVASQFGGKPKRRKKICPPNSVRTFWGNANQQLPIYRKALDLSEKNGREEGGWIYQNKKTGQVKAVLKDRDTQWDLGDDATQINLGNPRNMKGWRVVGTFHTHPDGSISSYPSGQIIKKNGEIWASDDQLANLASGIPGMIISRPDNGKGMATVIYGPNSGVFLQGLPKGCPK